MSDMDFEPIRNAIAETTAGGGFVSHYVVVAEVINPEGEGQIHTLSDTDHTWQVLGMLGHALEVAKRDKYYTGDTP